MANTKQQTANRKEQIANSKQHIPEIMKSREKQDIRKDRPHIRNHMNADMHWVACCTGSLPVLPSSSSLRALSLVARPPSFGGARGLGFPTVFLPTRLSDYSSLQRSTSPSSSDGDVRHIWVRFSSVLRLQFQSLSASRRFDTGALRHA